ncbi:conserved exported hypothetical protein [Burkholderiales bacterium 8X]|nr:conserved exported hypothetical protein [Burkholderiales bacterium 8X]
MKKFAVAGLVSIAFFSANAFAQSGGISIPGVGKANGSTGSEVTNSKITVSNNSAKNVIAGGGSAGIKIATIEMSGMANVNSVNVTGSKVKNSEIMVTGNTAEEIKAIGGTANVNSVNIN